MSRSHLFAVPAVALVLAALAGCASEATGTHVVYSSTTTELTSARVPAAPSQPAPDAVGAPYTTTKHGPERIEALKDWSNRFPDASVELAGWVQAHPTMAHQIAAWDLNHPEKMMTLADWTANRPYESFDAFRMNRTDWDELASIQSEDPGAFRGLLDWMRNAPPAARDLAWHPDAIAYATAHVYDLSNAMKRESLARYQH